MKELLSMFVTFFKIGAVTFGGGYTMLPMLQREVVEKNGWASEEELLDYYAVGQCIPGIIAVNTALFIGYKRRKLPGAIASMLGVISPSIIIIIIIAALITNFLELKYVGHALMGIRAVVSALIIDAVIKLWKNGIKDKLGIVLFLVIGVIMIVFSPNPIIIVVAACAAGIVAVKAGVAKV